MSIRTTITLEDDIVAQLKAEQRSRGVSFRDLVNDLLRLGLALEPGEPVRRSFSIAPFRLGFRAGLNHDDVESLIEYGEGSSHR